MKVFIGGLLPAQQHIVEQACPPGVELRFAISDRGSYSWGQAGRNCDYCILVTGFVNHKHAEGLKAAGCNVIRHSGGITKLKKLINELAKKAP